MTSKQPNDLDDERYETEEFLVYVDLDTKLLDEQLSKSNTKVKFLGIDTENPIMQLNNQLFKGNFNFILICNESHMNLQHKMNSCRNSDLIVCVTCFIVEFP